MNFEACLVDKREVAEGTMAFSFEKPAGFSFKAGQFLELTLINPPETDTQGNTRAFSIVAAPFEKSLIITTRLRDTAFKRVLKAMPLGAAAKIEGPFGSMTLHNDVKRPAVILAGGIGITPFISMIRHATHENLPHQITLFYSNRRLEDAAFLAELQEIQAQNSRFRFVATMTEPEKSSRPWNGERGYINAAMIRRHFDNISEPIYYSAGPAAMVIAMRTLLNQIGVDDDWIRTEEFSGY